jgi:predicted RNA binding protein YcfA (HicA-like mRNA interferase family)
MFCDNLKKQMDALGMTAKDVSNAMEQSGFVFRRAKKPHRIVESWISKTRPYHPELLTAIALAKVLQTTVEELVDGEAGEQYLRDYIQKKGWKFSLQKTIADIVEALQRLSADELVPIRGAIKAILEKKEASGAAPEAIPPQEAGKAQ